VDPKSTWFTPMSLLKLENRN